VTEKNAGGGRNIVFAMQDGTVEEKLLADNARSTFIAGNEWHQTTDAVYQSENQCGDDLIERTRLNAIRVTYLISFVLCVEYGVVIATLWPYLRKVNPEVTALFLGLTASSYSISHLLFTFLFGYWVEKRNAKEPLVFSVCTIIAGSVVYAYAETVSGSMGSYMILISRSIIGLVSGADVALRTFISQATRSEEKTRIFGNLAMFGVLGFLAGPAFQIVLSFLRGYDLKIDVINMHISIYTAPAYIAILLSTISLASLLIWFKDTNSADSPLKTDQSCLVSPDLVAVGTNMVIVISYQFCYTSYETLLSPILIDEFSLDNKDAIFYASLIFFAGLIIILFGFDIAKRLIDRFDVPKVIVFGSVLLLVTFVVILPWGSEHPELQKIYVIDTGNTTTRIVSDGCSLKYSWCATTPKISIAQLLLYSLLVSLAFPLMYLSQFVMLSGILSPKHQGYYMAIVSSCGSAARIVGPLVSMYFYGRYGPRWTFLLIDAFLIIVLFIVIATYKRNVPYDQYVENIESKLYH